MAPQKYASMRHRGPSALVPFRDDLSLVALRYSDAKQAEPPIPIPPPRSPLRNPPQSPRSGSSISAQSTSLLLPARPPTPNEQHPALRIRLGTHANDAKASHRDSGIAATTSSHSYTPSEASQEDEGLPDDDKLGEAGEASGHVNIRSGDIIPVLPRLRSLDRAPSPSSIYSEAQEDGLVGEPNNQRRARFDCFEDDSLGGTNSIPGLSDGNSNTVSPITPTTPPPATFPDSLKKTASLLTRSLSLRSSSSMSSSKKSSNKLAKTPPSPAVDATPAAPSPIVETLVITTPPPAEENGSTGSGRESPITPLNPNFATDDGDWSAFVTNISFSKRGSIMLGGQRPAKHKKPFLMNAHDRDSGIGQDTTGKERPVRVFPLAPSLMPISHANGDAQTPTAEPKEIEPRPRRVHKSDAIPEENEDEEEDEHVRGRHVSLIADPPVAASTPAPATPPPRVPTSTSKPSTPVPPVPVFSQADEAASTPRSPAPPCIRLISMETERESRKVRSLYESGDGLKWEDGGRLEPTAEVPSDADDDNHDKSHPTPSPHPNLIDRPLSRTRPSGLLRGPAESTASRRDEARRAYELAGGIEDWEDVNGEDVDRYGFIQIRRPGTRSSTPADYADSKAVQHSPRRQRVLRKEQTHLGQPGGRRGPTRKISARSLNTQASEMSTASRVSTRSAMRQAANLLPHNRDRKWTDEAGDMLSLQPGLGAIADDECARKLTDEHRRKEWERADKWRKMAKVVKPGEEGEGMTFEFDVKNPKLIERTWKGIPDVWRAAAWFSFLSTSARNCETPQDTDEELMEKYRVLQEEPSADDMQIDLDVPRTINQHIMFRRRYRGGQRLLFRVLHALSLYFPETGYVQGMASLGATLLNYFDEERCFIMLVRLWDLRGLNRLYQPGFEELMAALNDFDKHWLADKDVAKKLRELCIDPTAYGTRWYLTLFNLSIPFQAQLRVWDVFMLLGGSPSNPPHPASAEKDSPQPHSSQGLEILHSTSTAIIHALHDHLIDSEFENAMKALTSWVPIKNEDLLMKVVRAEYKQHMKSRKT